MCLDLDAHSIEGEQMGVGWWPYCDANGNVKENSTCNALRGTDGAQFPPGVKKDDTLWVFNTLHCRSLYFNFEKKDKIEGIPILEFGVPLEGGNINRKENVCTCRELSEAVADMIEGEESCVKPSDDPEAFDSSKIGVARVHRYVRDDMSGDSETEYVMWYVKETICQKQK